ncbi:F-box protein CPR1 [Setaria viridis]|uniref:F-box protein CPR1 n=1 Tax=Setaria viridis TaxID=4556 RepID=UPI0014939B21|nr:uncharacterized protein LOC117848996 [Setaria viridis]
MLSSPDLNGDAVAEILLRLPSPSVLRCRAICRAWCAISSNPGFVAAHAYPPPPRAHRGSINLPLHPRVGPPNLRPAGGFRTRPRPLISNPRVLGPDPPDCHPWLLLFGRDSFYGTDHLVCNPVTRQWTAVPPLCARLMTRLCGFYLHGPSGEHRLLFLANDDDYGGRGTSVSHYVRSLEAGETRRLGPAAATVNVFSQIYHKYLDYHGKLHWLRHPEVGRTNKIVVFDTVSEALRRTSQPPLMMNRYDEPSLLEMDGMVAMAAILHGSQHMDLWVLEDYGSDEKWTRRHRIDLPPAFSRARWAMSAGVVGRNSNLILLGDSSSGSLGLYDLTEKRVLKQVQIVL